MSRYVATAQITGNRPRFGGRNLLVRSRIGAETGLERCSCVVDPPDEPTWPASAGPDHDVSLYSAHVLKRRAVHPSCSSGALPTEGNTRPRVKSLIGFTASRRTLSG